MDEEIKIFWTSKAAILPPVILKSVYLTVKNKNDLMDKYILAAIKEKPVLLTELKNKINKIKLDALGANEKAQSPDADEELAEQLKNI